MRLRNRVAWLGIAAWWIAAGQPERSTASWNSSASALLSSRWRIWVATAVSTAAVCAGAPRRPSPDRHRSSTHPGGWALREHHIPMRTLLVDPPLAAGTIELSEEAAHHGRSVRRLRVGEELRIADGAGHAARAVVRAGRRTLTVETIGEIERLPPDRAAELTVACAVPKGDRFADLVR